MKKIVNGEYVDMTEEEYKEWKKFIDDMPPISDEPTADDKAEAYDILMGVSE